MYDYQKRDRAGKYTKGSNALAGVFGIVILATFYLVLNHFNAARLDKVSDHNCAVTNENGHCIGFIESLNAAN